MLVDVHAHMDDPKLEKELPNIIKRAEEKGVKAILSMGLGPITNQKQLDLAKRYPMIKPCLGLYPPDAMGEHREPYTVEEVEKQIQENKETIPCIGEIGLDKYHGGKTEDGWQEQIIAFKAMLTLAKKLNLPVSIHSRKAEKETIEIVEQSELKPKQIILHCFCGNKKLVERAAKNGWSFSIPTSIVRTTQFQELVKQVNISQLLTETDAPYLSPFKEKWNEAAFIEETIKVIAEIKKLDVEETKKLIYMNYQRIF